MRRLMSRRCQEIQGGFALRKKTLNESAFQMVVLAAVLGGRARPRSDTVSMADGEYRTTSGTRRKVERGWIKPRSNSMKHLSEQVREWSVLE